MGSGASFLKFIKNINFGKVRTYIIINFARVDGRIHVPKVGNLTLSRFSELMKCLTLCVQVPQQPFDIVLTFLPHNCFPKRKEIRKSRNIRHLFFENMQNSFPEFIDKSLVSSGLGSTCRAFRQCLTAWRFDSS